MNTSKFTYFILFIASLLLFTACHKDDDNYNNDTINPELLVATWRPASAKIISGVDGSTIGPLDIPTCRNLWEYIYESNGSFTLKKYAKNTDDECIRREDWDDHGIYTFEPSTSTLTMEDDEGILGEAEVYKLTSSEMQLRQEYGDENNDGVGDFNLILFHKVN